ncbi:MAG: hypothetical protein K2J82_08765 [Muribaculaceae bacterium]|nr:hypothetical protein [Muribaculaceae bacterium]
MRFSSAFSITPYIEDGDTLMYVVQYEKGWEIYSAKLSSPMILFSSQEASNFDVNDPTFPDALKNLIFSVSESIKSTASLYPDSIHSSWGYKMVLVTMYSVTS